MFKTTSRPRGSGIGPSGLVDHVDRSPRKRAQQVWVLVGVIAGLATMVVASESIHPILAVLLGLAAGFVIGGLCALWVYVWPLVRFVWWWLPEITLLVGATAGWMQLADHTTLPVRAAVVAVVVGVPTLVRPIRRPIVAVAWCFIIRHRIRKCFTDFITVGRFDPEPFILTAKPTKAGVTCWVLLRPGVSIDDVQNVTAKITSACWAKEVTVSPAKDTNRAYVRFDVTRRNAFVDTITSPLTGEISADVPVTERAVTEIPAALDYPDVTSDEVKPAEQVRESKKTRKATEPATASKTAAAVSGWGGEDPTDWI